MIPRVGKLALSGLMVVVMPGPLFGGGNRQDARSNVLFIMSDNDTMQAIGAYGEPPSKTQSDAEHRLARKGRHATW